MVHVDIGCFILLGGEGESGLQTDACWALLEAPTGIIYHQQAGGHMCAHPSAEGFLVPVQGPVSDISRETDNWGWGDGFSENEIVEVRRLVSECQLLMILNTKGYAIKFDDDRMDQAMEAWLPIITAPIPKIREDNVLAEQFKDLVCRFTVSGFGLRGWLVYENSD